MPDVVYHAGPNAIAIHNRRVRIDNLLLCVDNPLLYR